MRKVLIVARWEYLEKVKSRMFLISLLVMPVLIIGMGVLPGLLAEQQDERARVIGLIDPNPGRTLAFASRLQSKYSTVEGGPLYVVRPIEGDSDEGSAMQRGDMLVFHGEIEGFCIVSDSDGTIKMEYRSSHIGDLRIESRLRDVMQEIRIEKELIDRGLDPAILSNLELTLDVRMVKITAGGEEETGFLQTFLSAYAFLMMLFFMILSSGQLLVRSVIEEKMNRVVEILVSSCSPTQLMAGKVLGLSGLGFTQLLVWGIAGVVFSGGLILNYVHPMEVLLLVHYFVLGYLLYAAIFIGIGSPVTTEQEAQLVTSYLVIILTIPLMLTVPALQNPGAPWVAFLSYIPLLTPTMMALRISIAMPALWEIVLTTVVMLVTICVAMIIAGRIFRVAILATGKRASLREIAGWVRAG